MTYCKKHKKTVLLLVSIVVVVLLYLVNYIPLSRVIAPLHNDEEITRLSIYVDAGSDAQVRSLVMEDTEMMDVLLDSIADIRMLYLGGYNGIVYVENKPIITLCINNSHNRIDVTSDGTIYTDSTRYSPKNNAGVALYHRLQTLVEQG